MVAAPEILPEREAALTVPPETAEVRAPTTLMVPAEMPPVMAAEEPKVVLPAPEREERVMVPDEAVKFRAFASVALALVTAPTFRPAPEKVALPVASKASVAPDLKSAAVRIAPLTVMPEVPANAPVTAVNVPPETSVAPVKVLAPVSAQVPVPVLVTAERPPSEAPEPSEITPETLLPAWLPPRTKVPVPVARPTVRLPSSRAADVGLKVIAPRAPAVFTRLAM